MRISDWSSDVCSSDLFRLLAMITPFASPHRRVSGRPLRFMVNNALTVVRIFGDNVRKGRKISGFRAAVIARSGATKQSTANGKTTRWLEIAAQPSAPRKYGAFLLTVDRKSEVEGK